PHRVLALRTHGPQHDLDVLVGVAKRPLQHRYVSSVGDCLVLLGLDRYGAQPRLPRLALAELALDVRIVQDLVPFAIERQHLAGTKSPLLDDAVIIQLDSADFGACDDESLRGDLVAAWPQAVAIERRPDVATVGEGERSWTVPRLDHRRVIAIERLRGG